MQVENGLNLPQTVDVATLTKGKGFSYNGQIYVVKAAGSISGGNAAVGFRFIDEMDVSLSVGTQVYACDVKVVASPLA